MIHGGNTRLLFLTAAIMMLPACTAVAPSIQERLPVEDPVTAPVIDKAAPRSVDEPMPDPLEEPPAPDTGISEEPPAADPETARSSTGMSAKAGASPAVVELLQDAQSQAQAGNAENAAATLERAIRIEPDNPWVWHRLAVLRLQQSRWEQARELASRSNSLAQGHTRLLAGNWLVIAYAYEGQGNSMEAGRARARSQAYSGR